MKKIYAFSLAAFLCGFCHLVYGQPADCPSVTGSSLSCTPPNQYTLTVNYSNPGGNSGLLVEVFNNGLPLTSNCFKLIGAGTGNVQLPFSQACGSAITYSVTPNVSPQCTGNECGEGALPIQLVLFEGSLVKSTIRLHWQTAQEVNNEMFKIEKSADGETWRSIGQIDGAVNSNAILNYEFIDKSPVSGHNYYRLVQQDLDGKKTPSHIIQVNYQGSSWEPLILLNQVDKVLQVFTKTIQGNANLRLYNLHGQVIINQRIQDGGYQSLHDLPSGTYLCQLIDRDQVFVKKIVLNN